MKSESRQFLGKARRCLADARKSLQVGLSNDAGRGAYLAAFHAVQAYIFECTGKAAKTHQGAQSLFHKMTLENPAMDKNFPAFLTQAYNLKAVADYETGPDSEIPPERSAAAIENASRLLDHLAQCLETA